jgi:hypothetical protein
MEAEDLRRARFNWERKQGETLSPVALRFTIRVA